MEEATRTQQQEQDLPVVHDTILLKVYFFPGGVVRRARVQSTINFSELSQSIREMVEKQEGTMWTKGTNTRISCCVCGDNQETEWFNLSNEEQWQNVVAVTRLLNETREPNDHTERFLRLRAVGLLTFVPLSTTFFSPMMSNWERRKSLVKDHLSSQWQQLLSTGSNLLSQTNYSHLSRGEGIGTNNNNNNTSGIDEDNFVLLEDLDPSFLIPEIETLNEIYQQLDTMRHHDDTQMNGDNGKVESFDMEDEEAEEFDDEYTVSSPSSLSCSPCTPCTPSCSDELTNEEEEPFKYEQELELLRQMGLDDSERVRDLLNQFSGDMPKVVSGYLYL